MLCKNFLGVILSGKNPTGCFPQGRRRQAADLSKSLKRTKKIACRVFPARDGRDSPLKYTDEIPEAYIQEARDGRDSPLKYTLLFLEDTATLARDGRDSPLKYTHS